MTQKPAQRRGLGRGLGSLIPTAPVRTEEAEANGHGEAGIPAPSSSGPGEAAATAPENGSVTSPELPESSQGQEPAAQQAELTPVEGAYFAELPVGAITPNPRQGARLGSAARAVGRRARAAAGAFAPCARRPSAALAPAHPALSPCSPSAAARLPYAARGAHTPVRPQGLPGGQNPSPARRDHSVAAGRACAVKAEPCAALRVAPAPALTAPTPLLAKFLPPGRKNGLGLRVGRTGGAPAGRGAPQCGRWRQACPSVLSHGRPRAWPGAAARAGAWWRAR